MRIVRIDDERGLALCEDADGGRAVGRDRARGRCRRRRQRARPRRRGAGAADMRYVDEFRDADLGRALAGEILGTVEPGRHYKVMEVCGGHTHSIYKLRDRRPAAGERRARPRPGLPGLRDPDGPRRRRHRDRARAGRDLHLLRRHDARARLERDAARREGRGRRRADGLLAARRPADRQRRARPRGRLLRDRVRDHGAVDRADADAGARRGHPQLLAACATT